MRNALKYFYNIYCTDIVNRNDSYKIIVDNSLYYFIPYSGNIALLESIYSYLIKNKLYCHEIILNKDNQYITTIENTSYILIRTRGLIHKLNYSDISSYNALFNKDICKWANLWSNKVDYYAYQMNQFRKKYPLLFKSFNYYSGLTECAIMLVGTVHDRLLNNYIQHKRIYKNTSTLDFFNPLNMIIDVKVRDICEYFKQQFFYVENPIIDVKNYLDYVKLTNDEAILFIARLLYPSYYFDLYDEIVQDKLIENRIDQILSKVNDYELFLEEVYAYVNLYYKIPEIEWLLKV